MNLTTKFDLGQKVYTIEQETVAEWEPCGFCEERGEIAGADGTVRSCPQCYGSGGKRTRHRQEWAPAGPLTLGKVSIEYTAQYDARDPSRFTNFGSQSEHREEQYMARETGIGTGRLHHADLLFATREEAEQECERRNAALREEVTA